MADPLAPYADTIDAAAKEWGHDPNMLRALILQESGGKPGAVSSKGARGLTQIIPPTATGLGITNPNDTTQQIFGAAKYLAEGRDKEGSPEGALLYYHGGADWRKHYGPESAAYVPGVAAHYTRLTKAAAPASNVPSDEDFLKQVAPAKPDAPAVPSDDEFLKLTGAAPGSPPTAPPTMTPNDISGEGRDEYGNPLAPLGPQAESPLPAMPKSIADLRNMLAETPGWTAGGILPIRVKNDAAGNADPALGMRPDLGPLRGAGNALLDLLEGTGQGTPGSPLAGRVTPEATNLLLGLAAGGGLTPSVARWTGLAIADNAAAPLSAEFRANPLAPGVTLRPPNALASDVPTMTVRPGMGGPEPAPQSAGAAASSAEESGISPAQALAYRSTAEGQKLLEPQPIGVPDTNIYVHGSNPNTAEIEQTVNTARELKSLNMTAPRVSQEAKQIAELNNEARAQHFAQTAGSDVDVLNAKAARAAQAEKDLAATFGNKTEADASPVLDVANEIKSSLDGKRPLVRNAVDAVTKELFDKDGKLETDPEQLYGVRKHIDDLMSKEAGADDPKSVRAMANLARVKAALDDVIETAAPGFRQYLDNFSTASRRIDEMEVLQKYEPKLFDAQNRMTYNKVQTMMRQIVDSRQAPGINPHQSITDDTMARLWALRDDLRRSASAQELARTPGSDTAQNAWDAAKGVMGGMAGEAAIHGTANALLGPLGSPVAAIGKNVFNALRAGKIERRQTARGMELLNPDRSRLHNPLAGP